MNSCDDRVPHPGTAQVKLMRSLGSTSPMGACPSLGSSRRTAEALSARMPLGSAVRITGAVRAPESAVGYHTARSAPRRAACRATFAHMVR